MAKGGARARSGPPPDPSALRRDRDAGDWITLDAEGRPGDPPAWPLSRATARERELWEREWRRPQAIMWDRLGLETEVALYVRSTVAAEKPKAAIAARTLVLRQQESLGISLSGLARNRWRIGHAEPQAAPRQSGSSPARRRFKVVDGGGGA